MTNFQLTTDSLTEKYYAISIKIKIRIYQLLTKIELKQQNLNQIRQFDRAYSVTFKTEISQFHKESESEQWK